MRDTTARARAVLLGFAVATALVTAPVLGQTHGSKSGASATALGQSAQHLVITPEQMKWGPAHPGLPPGSQGALLKGDPSKAEPFTLAAKMPAGYTVPPHWHPSDESIVVVSGDLVLGTGDRMTEAGTTTLGVGSFAFMPKKMHHWVKTKTATTMIISGMGPFEITYINPNDDPRKKTTASR